jgi:DNA topoisomerase-1
VRPQLSAGRVQSVAVRLVVEREREIDVFAVVSSYKVVAIFEIGGKTFKSELPKKFKTKEEAEKFLQQCIGAKFSVKNLEVKPGKRSPSAPFTTSTLQQEASRKLGFSVAQTMVVAQKLYERGKISYMRTDSVTLSQDALEMARKVIANNYGDKYFEQRHYKTKSASAQEAHEAIRPTEMNTEIASDDPRDQRLYDLIRKRTLASQMADAELEKTVVTISSDKATEEFVGTGEVIKFDGFLKVYMESTDEESDGEQEGLIPAMNIGDTLNLNEATATQVFSRPPSRYTEASLVKKLEELGIGRPSTYAPTISTIQKRGYVVKEDREGKERLYDVFSLKDDKIKSEKKTEITGAEKSKMFPTDIGMLVNDFLVNNFKEILDYNFTAFVEKEFDDIANGELKWSKMLKEFYEPFHKTVEVTTEESERVTGERILGKDPATGLTLLVRVGRYGPMGQIGTTEEIEAGKIEKSKFAKLRNNQRIDTITFEEALELFKLPRNLGQFENMDVVVAIGRFGPYVKLGDSFTSMKKEDDPYTVSYERAIELIKEKRKVQAERIIKIFDEDKDVQVLNGRFGPYIQVKDKNVRIPKDRDPKSLTLDEIYELAANAPPPKKWGRKSFGNKNQPAFKAPLKKKAAVTKKVAVKAAKKKTAPKKK